MPRHVDDNQVDAIRCDPVAARTPAHPLCKVTGTDDDVLKPFLEIQVWSHLRSYAGSLAVGWGAAYDEWGFEYDTDDRDACDEPFDGVRVFVPWDECVVGRQAFERLMARMFAAVLESISLQRSSVADEAWWPQLKADVAAFSTRVASSNRL